jgi:hypothetical protein
MNDTSAWQLLDPAAPSVPDPREVRRLRRKRPQNLSPGRSPTNAALNRHSRKRLAQANFDGSSSSNWSADPLRVREVLRHRHREGVGGVGGRLAEFLVQAGARVLVSDVDAARVRALATRLPVRAVAPERALRTDCYVLAPCAIGDVLNERSIPLLRCRIVAGAANNQLATAADGERLREAGILYAPDYVINSGGSLYGIGLAALGWTQDELHRRLVAIGETLSVVYREADAQDIATSEAAERLAAARLGS